MLLCQRPTPASFSAHHYRKPHIITLVYLLGAIAVAGTLWFFLSKANQRRDALYKDSEARLEKAGASINDSIPVEERLLLGDRHKGFRYQL